MLNTVHKIIDVNIARSQSFGLLLSCLFLGGSLAAQSTPLMDYVRQVKENNPELAAARTMVSEREIDVSLAEANRTFQADVKSDYLLSAGGRRISIPIGDLFNPTYATLNQLTGEERFPTDLDNTNERFIPSNFHDTRVEARMPIIQAAIGREIALRQAQVTEAQSEVAIRELELVRLTKDYYYGYLRALEGQRIIDSSLTVLEELLSVNESLVRNGKANRDIVYRTEAEIAGLHGQKAQLEQQALVARAALNRLRGEELDATLSADFATADTSLTLMGFPALADMARRQRPELARIDAGLISLDRLMELRDAGAKPSLGLSLTAGAQGFLDGNLSDHPYLIAGLGFSWNIFDGNKRKLLRQQDQVRAEQLRYQRKDAERAIELQSWEAWQRIRAERSQLSAARSGARAAEESFRITAARYRNQQALLVEYLDARNQWTTKQLEENLARYRLLSAYAALEAAVGE